MGRKPKQQSKTFAEVSKGRGRPSKAVPSTKKKIARSCKSTSKNIKNNGGLVLNHQSMGNHFSKKPSSHSKMARNDNKSVKSLKSCSLPLISKIRRNYNKKIKHTQDDLKLEIKIINQLKQNEQIKRKIRFNKRILTIIGKSNSKSLTRPLLNHGKLNAEGYLVQTISKKNDITTNEAESCYQDDNDTNKLAKGNESVCSFSSQKYNNYDETGSPIGVFRKTQLDTYSDSNGVLAMKENLSSNLDNYYPGSKCNRKDSEISLLKHDPSKYFDFMKNEFQAKDAKFCLFSDKSSPCNKSKKANSVENNSVSANFLAPGIEITKHGFAKDLLFGNSEEKTSQNPLSGQKFIGNYSGSGDHINIDRQQFDLKDNKPTFIIPISLPKRFNSNNKETLSNCSQPDPIIGSNNVTRKQSNNSFDFQENYPYTDSAFKVVQNSVVTSLPEHQLNTQTNQLNTPASGIKSQLFHGASNSIKGSGYTPKYSYDKWDELISMNHEEFAENRRKLDKINITGSANTLSQTHQTSQDSNTPSQERELEKELKKMYMQNRQLTFDEKMALVNKESIKADSSQSYDPEFSQKNGILFENSNRKNMLDEYGNGVEINSIEAQDDQIYLSDNDNSGEMQTKNSQYLELDSQFNMCLRKKKPINYNKPIEWSRQLREYESSYSQFWIRKRSFNNTRKKLVMKLNNDVKGKISSKNSTKKTKFGSVTKLIIRRRAYEKAYRDKKKNTEEYKAKNKLKNEAYKKDKKKSSEYVEKRREYERKYRERLKENPTKLEQYRIKKKAYCQYRKTKNLESTGKYSQKKSIRKNCDTQGKAKPVKTIVSISDNVVNSSVEDAQVSNEVVVTNDAAVKDVKGTGRITNFDDLLNAVVLKEQRKTDKRRNYEKAYRDRKKLDVFYKEKLKEKNRKQMLKYRTDEFYISKRLEYERQYRERLRLKK